MTDLQKQKCEDCVWRCETGSEKVLCLFPKCRRGAYPKVPKRREEERELKDMADVGILRDSDEFGHYGAPVRNDGGLDSSLRSE